MKRVKRLIGISMLLSLCVALIVSMSSDMGFLDAMIGFGFAIALAGFVYLAAILIAGE